MSGCVLQPGDSSYLWSLNLQWIIYHDKLAAAVGGGGGGRWEGMVAGSHALEYGMYKRNTLADLIPANIFCWRGGNLMRTWIS